MRSNTRISITVGCLTSVLSHALLMMDFETPLLFPLRMTVILPYVILPQFISPYYIFPLVGASACFWGAILSFSILIPLDLLKKERP